MNPPPGSLASSAIMPSYFVLLIVSSYLVGPCTGRLAGFSDVGPLQRKSMSPGSGFSLCRRRVKMRNTHAEHNRSALTLIADV
jgi:hypothetical protein